MDKNSVQHIHNDSSDNNTSGSTSKTELNGDCTSLAHFSAIVPKSSFYREYICTHGGKYCNFFIKLSKAKQNKKKFLRMNAQFTLLMLFPFDFAFQAFA